MLVVLSNSAVLYGQGARAGINSHVAENLFTPHFVTHRFKSHSLRSGRMSKEEGLWE